MVFGQTNTGFQVGIGRAPFSTGLNTGFSTPSVTNTSNSTKKTTTKKKDSTYNSRYPGFNEEEYKKLEKMVADKGIIGKEKYEIMDQLYEIYYPQVLNQHKLDERQQEINNSVYKNGELLLNGNKEAQIGTKLTQLSQMAKQKFNIPYNTPDNDVIEAMSNGIPNGSKLLYDYINNGNPELLYQAGIQDRPQENNIQQGGTKNLINQLSVNNGDKTTWNQIEDITNKTNVIGLGAEKVDQKAGEFADKWLDWGNSLTEGATENLKNKLESMSKKEVAKYRKQYEKLLKDKDWRVGKVAGDTIVEQLWNGIKGDISYDYSDEDFAKWLVSQKANLGESLVGADDILSGETDPNVIQLFGNIPASAVKTFTATVRGMSNPYDTMKGLYILGKDVADNGFKNSAIGQRYGSWDGFAKALNEDPVGVADDALAVAEGATNLARGTMNLAGKVTGNQSLITNASKIPQIGSANDVLADRLLHGGDLTISKNLAQDLKNTDAGLVNGGFKEGYNPDLKTINTKGLYGVMDSTLGNKGVLGTANKVLQTESDLGKMTKTAKEGYDWLKESKLGKGVSNFADELLDKTVGIKKEDRQFIRDNKDLVNDYVSKKKNSETLYNEVSEKLSDKALENTEMGKEYDKLAQNTEKVVVTEGITNDKDLQKLLKKGKITIDADGNLQFDKLSEYNATQQKAIQDAWETLKAVEEAKNIDAGTVLDQRRKFDDKIDWEGKSQSSTKVNQDAENLIKQMRRSVDTRAKQYVPGLAELDAKYQPLIDEVRQMKKDRFNSDGTMKDNARSKIRNLTKAGNEAKLERLEKIAPGITQDLKALDVALTVEKVTQNTPGQYIKGAGYGGSAITALFTGHPVAAIGIAAVGVLATPKNFVWLLSNYPELGNKILAGAEFTPAEISRLQAIASRLEDGME